MERVLMNMIFDENKIVTAVTLSRSQDIPIEEAFSAMKQFYEKHRNSNGLWATFNVTGSATICGVCANSTVLCRDCDLDRIKDSFSEVFAVELFSLQIVEVEDLKQVMSIVRLQDEKFFRLNNDRAPVHSTEVLLMARDLRDEVRRANSDILLAMKAVLDGKNESHYANEEGRVVGNVEKKGGHVKEAEIDKKCRLSKDEEISPDGQSPDSSTASLEQPSPNLDNLSKLSTSSKDPVDSKPFQNVPSKLCHGETAVQPKHDGFGEESADDDKELISCKRKNVSNCDEVPAKKRQTERAVETYRDEDGFLITKEVVRMVEAEEPVSKSQFQPLRSVNTNKVSHPPPTKRSSSRVSNTPKISAFFSKK